MKKAEPKKTSKTQGPKKPMPQPPPMPAMKMGGKKKKGC